MTRWFARLLLVAFIFQAGAYAVRPMVSYRAIELDAGPAMIGVIASSYAALSLVMAVLVGRWVDRYGEARFMVAGLALIVGTTVSLLWIESLWVLAASQAVMGLGHIMTLLGCQTLIANAAAPARRDADFGIFMVTTSLGQLAGPAIAGLLAGGGTRPEGGPAAEVVFTAAAGAALLALVIAVSLHLRPGGSGADGGDRCADGEVVRLLPAVGQVMRVKGMPPAMLASLTVLTTVDVLGAYLPVYGEETGLSVEVVGLLLALRAAASLSSRLLMTPLLRLLGRRWLLISSMVLPAVALATVPFQPLPGLVVVMVATGFGLGLGQPITLSWVTGRASRETRGTAVGVRLTGNRLGQLVLPTGVGVIAGAAGVSAIFPALGALLLLSAGLLLPAPLDDAAPGEGGAPPGS